MPNYSIVASDLDGTLLLHDMSLSAENAAAITAMAQKGVVFSPASGRTLCEMPKAVMTHPHIRYYIYSNGAAIWDKQTDTHTYLCMPQAVSNAVLDMLQQYDCHITVRQGGRSYADATMHTEADYKRYQICSAHHDVLEMHADFKEEFVQFAYTLDNVECYAIFFPDDEKLAECKERVGQLDGVSVAWSWPHCFEIFSVNGGKGFALQKLAEIRQVPFDSTIAVGDSGNDMSMIQAAGLGLATSNACDALKDAANQVICSNTEHVAEYILKHYL